MGREVKKAGVTLSVPAHFSPSFFLFFDAISLFGGCSMVIRKYRKIGGNGFG